MTPHICGTPIWETQGPIGGATVLTLKRIRPGAPWRSPKAAHASRENSGAGPSGSCTWFESGFETAAEDPLLIQRFGELALKVRAADVLLTAAAHAVDAARADLTDDTAAEASIEVAAAKVAAAEAAVEVAGALFEVAGTRSALASLGLDRHWRDARTHTLRDPARWKVAEVSAELGDGCRLLFRQVADPPAAAS